MAYNKVIYGGSTLIDLTNDTVVSSEHIMQGYTGHTADGVQTVGTGTSDATAGAEDILNGETAYVSGVKLSGTLVMQKYYTGSSAPASSLGNDGDIYIQV